MSGRLEKKTAVVTGGRRGIGAAIVTAFASEGADVMFCHDGDHEGAAIVVELAASTGRRVRSMECGRGPCGPPVRSSSSHRIGLTPLPGTHGPCRQ